MAFATAVGQSPAVLSRPIRSNACRSGTPEAMHANGLHGVYAHSSCGVVANWPIITPFSMKAAAAALVLTLVRVTGSCSSGCSVPVQRGSASMVQLLDGGLCAAVAACGAHSAALGAFTR